MIQVYTGNGKGKTTAAVGLAIRAAGAGLRVYICQFLKQRASAETGILKKIKNISLERFGSRSFVRPPVCPRDRRTAYRGLCRVKEVIASNRFDVIILDEINLAVRLGLIATEDILALIGMAGSRVELVFTGRYAHPALLRRADLVSEVRARKHYYRKGVKGRQGIEY